MIRKVIASLLAGAIVAVAARGAAAQDASLCRRDPTNPQCDSRWSLVILGPGMRVAAPPYAVPIAYPVPYATVLMPAMPPPVYPIQPAEPVLYAPPYPAAVAPAPDPVAAGLIGGMMFLGTSLMLHGAHRHAIGPAGPGMRLRPRR